MGGGVGEGEHPWLWIWYQSPVHTVDGGTQKVCPLTSFPDLTMTMTVALANDYSVNLPIIASLSQHKLPVLRVGRSVHSDALRTGSLLFSPC